MRFHYILSYNCLMATCRLRKSQMSPLSDILEGRYCRKKTGTRCLPVSKEAIRNRAELIML